ncbi:MAG TPA: glycosyltransferase family 39 protein, partial [bacterium]|nr:glycosyltransferase family 39 protein [bacterium]
MQPSRIILLVLGAGGIAAGLAVKGFFTAPAYRRTRWKTLLVLATAAAIGWGCWAAAVLPGGTSALTGKIVDPAVKAGRALDDWLFPHLPLLRRAAAALAAGLILWAGVARRKGGAGFILLVLGLSFALAGGVFLSAWNFFWGPLFLVAGGVYAFASAAASPSPLRSGGRPWAEGVPAAAMAALTVLLAFALRVHLLGAVSVRFDHYESDYAWQALNVLNGQHAPSLWTSTIWRGLGHLNLSPVYTYCVALSFRLLGVSLASLKLVPVVYGTLSVLLTYGIVGILFGKRLALISALLMAVSPLHINYSRIGLLLCSTQTVSLLIVFLLLRALLRRDVTSWILLGAACSFAGYFYSPAKYPVLLAAVLILFFLFFHRGFLRGNLPGLAAGVLAVVAIGAVLNIPVFRVMAPSFAGYESVWHRTQGHLYTPQADYLRGLPLVWENLLKLGEDFFFSRNFNYDPWPRGNLFFNPGVSVLFILGIGTALARIRKLNYRLLLFFLAAFLVPNLLSRPPV